LTKVGSSRPVTVKGVARSLSYMVVIVALGQVIPLNTSLPQILSFLRLMTYLIHRTDWLGSLGSSWLR